MKTRVKMLKVKIKSLAAEARIIRLEERKSKPCGKQQNELHVHRVTDVRKEQRCSLLAYAFIRGVALSRVEAKSDSKPDWSRVSKLVEKFGTTDYRTFEQNEQQQRLLKWIAGIQIPEQSTAERRAVTG